MCEMALEHAPGYQVWWKVAITAAPHAPLTRSSPKGPSLGAAAQGEGLYAGLQHGPVSRFTQPLQENTVPGFIPEMQEAVFVI